MSGPGRGDSTPGLPPADLLSEAASLAHRVHALGRLETETVVVPVRDDLAARLDGLPDQFRAVLLSHVDPRVARDEGERAVEHGLRLVVSDHDGRAAALCAALLLHLRTVQRPLEVAKVVVAGGEHLPVLAPLLMIAGAYDLLVWHDEHAAGFPWRQAVSDADVAVDLRQGPTADAESAGIAQDRPEGSTLRPADAAWADNVVAGVLRVALACPPGSMHVDLDMLRACAVAIVAATPPPGHGLVSSAAITDAVEAAVRRVIDPRLATLGSTNDTEVT